MIEEIKKEYSHFRVRALNVLGFLTYRCTSQCRTCNIWKRNSDSNVNELSKKEWQIILSRLKKYGIQSFEVFGGDALLRKDIIFDMIRYCHSNHIKTYFPTNGNLCDRETINGLIDAGLDSIYLSIDDIEDKHDSIRGVEGTFHRIQKTLDILFDEKSKKNSQYPKVMIITTISNMNFMNLPNIIKYFERYPIDCIYPRNLVEFSKDNIDKSTLDGCSPDPFFVSSKSESHLLNTEQLKEFKQIIKEFKKNKSGPYVNFRDIAMAEDKTFVESNYGYKKCHAATTFTVINPNGDVVPCPFYNKYVLGNLLDNDLEDIWGNKKHREFIKLQNDRKIPLCQNCNLPVYHPSVIDSLKYYSIRLKDLIV